MVSVAKNGVVLARQLQLAGGPECRFLIRKALYFQNNFLI